MKRASQTLIWVLLAYLLVPVAGAAAKGLEWQQLSTEEQRVLEPFQSRWSTLSAERRLKLQKGSRRWAGMSAEERGRVHQRFKHWQELPPAERQRLRARYQRFRKLPVEQQKQIRRARRHFRELPPVRRQQLQRKWQDMSLGERRRFIQKRRGRSRVHVPSQSSGQSRNLGGRVEAPEQRHRRPQHR